MAQILIRDLNESTVNALKKRARSNMRSLEAEVRVILEDLTMREERRREAIAFADGMARRSGPQTTDSVELIREDRDR